MSRKPTIRVLHHLARSGGTVISQCLAVMDSVILLSEIHPLGTAQFNPLAQARDWFQLISDEDSRARGKLNRSGFVDAIALIHRRCDQRGKRLVIRDWSHLDFTGAPFLQNPSYLLQTAEVLRERFDVIHVATVRHPLDQLNSLHRLANIQRHWDEPTILHGFRCFAEQAVEIGFLRYEDFVADPDKVLRQLCERLQLDFDDRYKDRWADYRNITGAVGTTRTTIEAEPRGAVDPELLSRLSENDDYRTILELLGYEHPEPPKEDWLRPVEDLQKEASGDQRSAVSAGSETRAERGHSPSSKPADVDALFEKGNQFTQEKNWEEAVTSYQQFLSARPTHEWALNNIGYCLSQIGRFDWAIIELKRAIEVNGKNTLALVNLVNALEESGRKFEAIPYQRRLAELNPAKPGYPFNLAFRLNEAGRIDEALFYCRRTLELDPEHKGALSDYLLFLNYSDKETVESVAREHFRLAQRWVKAKRRPPGAFSQSRDPDRPLRIGYVSSSFYTHPDGKKMQPIIAAHNKKALEVYCYYSGDKHDYWTKKTKEVSTAFHELRERSDEEVEKLALDDRIDILVDLGGYTSGGNRLGVFSARAAPVQVSFMGYPNTTGLDSMDYFITDDYCDPPGQTEHLHNEQLIRMERGFLCFAPPPDLPAVVPAPYRDNGHITFGSFNNTAKLSETTLSMWAEILKRVPGSRLTFKYGDRFESEWLCERYRAIFAAAGVDPARLTFLPVMPTVVGHFEAIGSVDIALDPYPYQGTHTTLESLTMSVPVITLCGETYVRRASSALMMRLGLNDLVAESPEEYVNLAVELAGNGSLLKELRLGLRERFFNSEICDVEGFVRELEQVYRRLWSEWCASAAS